MMYRIYLSAIVLTLSAALYGQDEARRAVWSLSASAGPLSGYFLLDKNLAQDLDGYSHYKYRPSVTLGIHCRATKRRWSGALLWSRSSSRAYTSEISKTSKERIMTMDNYLGMLYRRFHVRDRQYLYWGVGAGIVHYDLQETPLPNRPWARSRTSVAVHIVPFGACVETGRVGMFFETALFQLPLVAGGVRVGLGR